MQRMPPLTTSGKPAIRHLAPKGLLALIRGTTASNRGRADERRRNEQEGTGCWAGSAHLRGRSIRADATPLVGLIPVRVQEPGPRRRYLSRLTPRARRTQTNEEDADAAPVPHRESPGLAALRGGARRRAPRGFRVCAPQCVRLELRAGRRPQPPDPHVGV